MTATALVAAAAGLAALASKPDDTVRLRARYRDYRVRDVQFSQHVATVPRAKMEELSKADFFGPGMDFWIDEGVEPVAVAEPPPPAEPAKPEDAPQRALTPEEVEAAKLKAELGAGGAVAPATSEPLSAPPPPANATPPAEPEAKPAKGAKTGKR